MSATLQELIDQLWDFNDPAGSEARFREACDKATHIGDQMELRTQVARAQGLQRKFDAAHATLNEIEASLAAHEPPSAEAQVRRILERGRVFNSSGCKDRARELFEQAIHAARQTGNDHLAIDAMHMVAIVSSVDESLRWNVEALKVAESSALPRARQWRGSLHNNIGWSLHDAGRFDDALTHFERALECRTEVGRTGDIHSARWCIARCLRSLGHAQEALEMQLSLLTQKNGQGTEDDGYIHEELGECMLAKGRTHEAAIHFAKAHRLLSQDLWLVDREPARLKRMADLAGEHLR